MPYFIYRIKQGPTAIVKNLELINQFDSFKEAKEFAINSIGMMLTITVAVTFLIRLLFYGAVIAYFLQAEIKPIFGEDSLEYLKAQNEGMPSPAWLKVHWQKNRPGHVPGFFVDKPGNISC